MEAIAIAKLIYDLIPAKAKETVTERFTNAAIDKANQLWSLLREKLGKKPNSENLLQAVETGDDSKISRLEVYVEDLMVENPELATQIEKLVDEIQQGRIVDKSTNTQIINDNGKGYQNNSTNYDGTTNNINEQHNYYTQPPH